MPPTFAEWIQRVRVGDVDAASELVRHYERAVRIAVRVRLTDPRLRRQFDSQDICQSVMASFFVRAAAGEFELDSPQQLVALLTTMGRNKLLMQVRHHTAQRRGAGLPQGEPPSVADPQPGPEQVVAARDLLATLLGRLGNDERLLAERRARGQTWAEIAADLGGTPQGHRMKLSRAIEDLAPGLGLSSAEDAP